MLTRRLAAVCAFVVWTLTLMTSQQFARAIAAQAPAGATSAGVTSAGATSAGVTPAPVGAPFKHRERKPLRPRGVHPDSGGTAYTIVDFGAPPGSSASIPAAFNNAGLIVGNAVITKKGAVDCELALGGGKFVDLSATNTDTYCAPFGMSNVNSSGQLYFVGDLSTEYQGYIPFLGTYTAKTGVGSLHVFTTASGFSVLSVVNAAGEAGGGGSYEPLGWVAAPLFPSAPLVSGILSEAPYVVPAGTTNFDVAQPACIPGHAAKLCASRTGTSLNSGDGCGFGGCVINDAGVILALDSFNQKLMTFSFGTTSSAKDLPIIPSAQTSSFINNANQVATAVATTQPGQLAGDQTYLYSISTGRGTLIPQIDVPADGDYYCEPLSLSNAGAILGSCTDIDGNVLYWTWTSKNGVQDLSTEIPVSAAFPQITPLGINDNGQILVGLASSTGLVHWGILDPPSSPATSAGRRRGN
jgi:hypothetical protein